MWRVVFLSVFSRRPAPIGSADQTQLADLYSTQAGAVYRYFRTRTHQPTEAEDLTSLVFRKALESWATYQPNQNAVGWLFGIARHVLADYYRRPQPNVSPLEEQADIETDDPGPEETALQAEEARLVRRSIRELPSAQAEVIILRFTAQLSYSEIAQATGRREPAVRMLVHRGLENLRKQLAAQPDREGVNL